MRRASVALMTAAALALLPGVGRVKADDDRFESQSHRRRQRFTADLLGRNEVPPVFSAGSGRLTMTLNEAEDALTFRMTYRNLTVPPSVSHVHFGLPRLNGGVVFHFCGGGGQPACPTTTSGEISGEVTIEHVMGPMGQGIDPADPDRFKKALTILRSELGYANLHSPRFPSGEIRGQVRRR
jgi:hypothetical protein